MTQDAGPLLFARPGFILMGAARNRLRYFLPRFGRKFDSPPNNSGKEAILDLKNMGATTRNPLFLFLLFGLFLFRMAQRTLFSLLLKAPPRNTRHL
jgi:hypothetical protein